MKTIDFRRSFLPLLTGAYFLMLFSPLQAQADTASNQVKLVGFSWLSGSSEDYPCFCLGWIK